MKKQNWWKTAFREGYLPAFDEIYSVKRGRKEVAFLIRELHIKKGARILDLACGQGRHAIPLAQLGMCVTGVDSSVSLLNEAKQRAQAKKVDILFTRGDMRTYQAAEQYDVVLVLGNSFGYFNNKDNKRVLSNIATSLKTGGWFVLDLSNTPGMLRRQIKGRWIQKIPGGKLTTHTLNFDPETFQVIMQWRILQRKRKTSFDGVLRLYTPPEINHLLVEQNLIIKKTYGSFTNEPYSIKTKRYLVVARKVSIGRN
jgi:2-polyprenyl-3-methyl-5-hydroxy-6-metoxy-1,4-benzoquinol methylase